VQKNGLTHERCYSPPQKIAFINAVRPFYRCQQSALKILRLLCRLGFVLRLGSVQFDLLAVIIWLRYVSPSGEWNISHYRVHFAAHWLFTRQPISDQNWLRVHRKSADFVHDFVYIATAFTESHLFYQLSDIVTTGRWHFHYGYKGSHFQTEKTRLQDICATELLQLQDS